MEKNDGNVAGIVDGRVSERVVGGIAGITP